ncbi:penicillin-binding protein activator [Guyparkeria sp. 1SP6A2]|nr:penicillin-binding protein activator [Guyparkeria sp. 1SP6A2]
MSIRQYPHPHRDTPAITPRPGHLNTLAGRAAGLAAIGMLLLAGCAQMPTSVDKSERAAAQAQIDQAIEQADPAALARARMDLSRTLAGTARAQQQLAAIETAVDAHEMALARELYQQADSRGQWTNIDSRRAAIARGVGQWSQGERDAAMRTIRNLPLPLGIDVERRRLLLLGALNSDAGNPLAAVRYYTAVDDQFSGRWLEQNHARIWDLLTQLDANRLASEAEQAVDAERSGWFELALTYRRQPGQIDDWIDRNSTHPAVQSGFVEMLTTEKAISTIRSPRASGPIAVLLPEDERYAAISREIRQGIEYSRETSAIDLDRELIHIDTGTTLLGAQAALEQAQRAGAAVIIGPLLKEQIGALASLPDDGPLAIALNAPAGDMPLPRGVISYSLSPEQDAAAVAARMWADGHRRVVVFAASNPLGQRAGAAFTEAFTLQGGEIVDRKTFATDQTDFSTELRSLLQVKTEEDGPFQPEIRDDVDAIFIASSGSELSLVVPQLNYFGAENLPRYSLGLTYSGNRDPQGDADKDGVIIPIAPLLLASTAGPDHPLRIPYERAQLAGSLPRLFAFGADAARLASRVDTLLKGGVVAGFTGELSVTSTGLVHREPHWGQFQDGLLQPLKPAQENRLPASPVGPNQMPSSASANEGLPAAHSSQPGEE